MLILLLKRFLRISNTDFMDIELQQLKDELSVVSMRLVYVTEDISIKMAEGDKLNQRKIDLVEKIMKLED